MYDYSAIEGVDAALAALRQPKLEHKNGESTPVEIAQAEQIVPAQNEIPQPNANGEFGSPVDGALWMAATYGIPQTPLKGKAPFLPTWQKNASTDPAQICAWAAEHPGCNFGSVAIPGRHFIFEADKPADSSIKTVRERFRARGSDFTAKLIIQSSPGKGHRYYLAAPGVENIAQNAVRYGDFSIRADGEQCVSPGSVHPDTKKQYIVAITNGPLTPPTTEEIQFWKSEIEQKKPEAAAEQTTIPEGKRTTTLVSVIGKWVWARRGPNIEWTKSVAS